jgi:hypothetical protein
LGNVRHPGLSEARLSCLIPSLFLFFHNQ